MDVEVGAMGDERERTGLVRLELFREARRCLRRSENALVGSSAFFFFTLLILPFAGMAGKAGLVAIPIECCVAVAVLVFQKVNKHDLMRWSATSQALLRGAPESREMPWESERTAASYGLVAHRLTAGTIKLVFATILVLLCLPMASEGGVGLLMLPIAVFLWVLVRDLDERLEKWASGESRIDATNDSGDSKIPMGGVAGDTHGS